VYRIAELKGIDNEELEKIRKIKSNERGKFNKNLFLDEIN
jgi:predicted house-cleaning noncanonical NTP pyrophosphatase (MazG superfamily)